MDSVKGPERQPRSGGEGDEFATIKLRCFSGLPTSDAHILTDLI